MRQVTDSKGDEKRRGVRSSALVLKSFRIWTAIRDSRSFWRFRISSFTISEVLCKHQQMTIPVWVHFIFHNVHTSVFDLCLMQFLLESFVAHDMYFWIQKSWVCGGLKFQVICTSRWDFFFFYDQPVPPLLVISENKLLGIEHEIALLIWSTTNQGFDQNKE